MVPVAVPGSLTLATVEPAHSPAFTFAVLTPESCLHF